MQVGQCSPSRRRTSVLETVQVSVRAAPGGTSPSTGPRAGLDEGVVERASEGKVGSPWWKEWGYTCRSVRDRGTTDKGRLYGLVSLLTY